MDNKGPKKKKSAFDHIGCSRSDSIPKLLKAVQVNFECADKRHLASLYNCMAVTFELRLRMNDEENWKEFCAYPRWEARQPRNRPKFLGATEQQKTHFVGIAAFAGKDEVRIDRASKYAGVIEHYREASLMPDRLPEQLKKDGGIEEVLRVRAGKSLKDEQSALLNALEPKKDDDYEHDEAEDNSEDDAASDNDEANDDTADSPSHDTIKKKKRPERLGLDVTRALLDETLDYPVGTRLKIIAVREEGTLEDKWKPIRIRKIIVI